MQHGRFTTLATIGLPFHVAKPPKSDAEPSFSNKTAKARDYRFMKGKGYAGVSALMLDFNSTPKQMSYQAEG